jgi:hypothetical protein
MAAAMRFPPVHQHPSPDRSLSRQVLSRRDIELAARQLTGLFRMATSVAGHGGHLLHFDRGDVHNLVVYFVQVADFVAPRLDCKGYVTANLREN